jgi:hypothetical protein
LPEGQTPLLNGIFINQEGVMWFVDLPVDLPDRPAIYMAADDSSAVSREARVYKFGVCRTINPSYQTTIYPISDASDLYKEYVNEEFDFSYAFTALKVIDGPSHGEFEHVPPVATWSNKYKFEYIPTDFNDSDTFVVEVEAYDVTVRIFYLMKIVPSDTPLSAIDEKGDRAHITLCEKESWLIEQPSSPNSTDPVSWIRSTSLQALLSGAKDALTSFADLSGAAIGQATGGGITLDTKAVVYGWRVDYTP